MNTTEIYFMEVTGAQKETARLFVFSYFSVSIIHLVQSCWAGGSFCAHHHQQLFLCSTCSRPGTLTHYPLFLPQFIQLLEPKYIQIHPQESYNLLWPLVERKAGAKTDWHAAASWSYQLSESSPLREAVPSQGCTGQQRTPDQDEVLQTSREHFK